MTGVSEKKKKESKGTLHNESIDLPLINIEWVLSISQEKMIKGNIRQINQNNIPSILDNLSVAFDGGLTSWKILV